MKMTQSQPELTFPDRKISETFLHFAEPLLSGLGPNATDDQMNEALKIAFVVWNSVVYDTVNGETKLVDQIHQTTSHDPDLSLFIAQLIFRKHNLFGDDHRLVGEFKLTRKDGEMNLRAEARDPRRR
jgi:hypothetical protein